MNTNGDMENEMYFYDPYKKFVYNHDYVKLMKYSYIYISMYTKYNYMYMCESIFTIITMSLYIITILISIIHILISKKQKIFYRAFYCFLYV